MNSSPYKIIFLLLVFSVLAILLLQGFWIRNFYTQKVDEFDKTIYASLEKINEKLEERQNMKVVKQNMLRGVQIRKSSTQPAFGKTTIRTKQYTSQLNTQNGKSVHSVIKVEQSSQTGAAPMISDSGFTTMASPKIMIRSPALDSLTSASPVPNIMIASTAVEKKTPSAKTTLTQTRTTIRQVKDAKKDEIGKLMDKMIMEIKIVDSDEKDPDTLKHLISSVLENKGVFTSFEFSLKKLYSTDSSEILSQSQKFDPLKEAYRSDLSANKIFTTHNYLFLQFPQARKLVITNMKNILLLCLLFSVIIILVFYYTIRLIFKQKKISDVKNDFINNMTHELKTPIATISLAVDGLNNPLVKNDLEKYNTYTSILKEENQKLNSHVERVLQMALLDKGELKLHQEKVELIKLISSSLETYRLQIDAHHAHIVFNRLQPEVEIFADGFHLSSVFNNLLDNALKYSNADCNIEIAVHRSLNHVIIIFKDNGIGIDADLKEKIFEKFYRVQGGNLHDIKGFGLGLSYVRSIIEKHNGSIVLQSEKGKGSEFIIKLPVNEI